MKAAISWLFQRNIVDEGGGGSEWVERGTWVLHLYVNYKQSCIECRMQFRHFISNYSSVVRIFLYGWHRLCYRVYNQPTNCSFFATSAFCCQSIN